MVEKGRYLDAILRFYAKEATMQENLLPPREGIAALIAAEEKALASYKVIRTLPGTSYAVEGDRVAINWVFDFVAHDGRSYRLNELAWQRWSGDKIVEERFFYDPGQRVFVERRKAARPAGAAKPMR